MSKKFCALCAFTDEISRWQTCIICHKEEPRVIGLNELCPYYNETEFWAMEDTVKDMTITDIIGWRVLGGDMLKIIPPISSIPLCVECNEEYVNYEGGLCVHCARDILLDKDLTEA